ncbi:MAG: Gfo/Idh/MocA family oxidoreductase [Clostridiales bacterium]|nr:Gfo/Idh/MocA family oxidoreductase [Clostridiales bacterium]
MKYALIGCGRVSVNHINAAVDNGLDIVGLCDIVPGKARLKAIETGLSDNIPCYTDYMKMIEDQKPELVAIATVSGAHAKIAVDCINAGCNVIIEKPMAMSIEDADKIIEAENRNGVKVCANHQNRFNDAVQHMRDALLGGRFGKLFYGAVSVRWMRDESYYKNDDWRGTWKNDGGTLMNQCIHAIDLLRWMMGDELTEVIGVTDNLNHPYIEGEDIGLAVLRFKNGSYGLLDGTVNTFGGDYEETLALFGQDGFAKLGGTCVNKIDEWRFSDGNDIETAHKTGIGENPPNVYGFGHRSLYTDMIEAIKTDRAPYIDSAAGKRALEAVLAIYKSSAEKRPVSLPLKNVATTDFIGLFDKK